MVTTPAYDFSWGDVTREDKHALRKLKATLILAPRELSEARLTELVREYLPKGHIIFGVSTEPYVQGFDLQPQFKMLTATDIDGLLQKTWRAQVPHKVYRFMYPQAAVDDVIRMVKPARALVVRGSYYRAFHMTSAHYVLAEVGAPYEIVSPFADEAEARAYLEDIVDGWQQHPLELTDGDDSHMLALADTIATQSFDFSHQTGCVVAERTENSFHPIVAACNEVVPYQTYALLHGASREEHHSEVHDLNHYDTIHAEMNALIQLDKAGVSIEGKTLFLNLLPCPNCARTLAKSGLREVVYRQDHSDGYAKQLLEQCKITVRNVEAQ